MYMNGTSVKVALRIMGDRYNVQEISRELGITPTGTWNMGEFIRNTGKKYKYTGWEYSTGEEETLDINTQLKKLEDVFLTKEDVLCRLKSKYDLDFSIDIVIYIENHCPPAIYLDSPIIKFAANIGARFDMDTYVH